MERVKFMECYYHPNVESTDVCAICGKSICKECGLEIAGKVYCKDCLEKIVGLSIKIKRLLSLKDKNRKRINFQK